MNSEILCLDTLVSALSSFIGQEQVFWLTECLINKEQQNISQFERGSFDQMIAFIKRTQQKA